MSIDKNQEIVFRCQLKESESEQFEMTYAYTMALGSKNTLKDSILKLEKRLWPCVTAWCPACKKPCLIVRNASKFPSISAHHFNRVMWHEKMKKMKVLY